MFIETDTDRQHRDTGEERHADCVWICVWGLKFSLFLLLPYPTYPLVRAVVEAAVEAATRDYRFPPVTGRELGSLVFEMSVLTTPELVEVSSPKEYPSKIKVGEDGLIVEKGFHKGLLLPRVPVEWRWDEEEFLCQCCMKAGLTPDNWVTKGTKIYKFQCPS